MSTKKPAGPWIPTFALALARKPKKAHLHPTVPGFYMRVSPKLKAVWAYRFRGPDGEPVADTIGNVGAVSDGIETFSLDDALEKYQRARRAAFNVSTTQGLTLQAAFDRWIVEHRKDGTGAPLAAATVDYYRINLNRYLADALDWVLADARTDDWMQILSKARLRSPSKARGTVSLLGNIYRHFIDLDVLEKNPIDKKIIRSNFAGSDSRKVVKTLVEALDLPAFYSGVSGLRNLNSKDGIMALVLTGWRRSGVLRMKWSDVNLSRGCYVVHPGAPGWKGFVGDIALGDYVIALLEERRERLTASKQGLGTYVFPAQRGNAKNKPYQENVRDSLTTVAKILGYRLVPHDLRRTFITTANVALGGNLRLVGKLVGHQQIKAKGGEEGSEQTANYVILQLKQERRAATKAEELLLEMMGALPLSDESIMLLKDADVDMTVADLTATPAEFETDDDTEDSEALA